MDRQLVTKNGLLVLLVFFAVTPAAHAAGSPIHVTNNGVDSDTCGPKSQTPCRTITQAIANASPGDTIIVGPGKYGDINNNFILGEDEEEAPPAGCGCLLAIDKSVTLVSSDGSAVTVLDAKLLPVADPVVAINVLITANDVQFGEAGHGFTVTNPDVEGNSDESVGILIRSDRVSVRGNQIDGHEPVFGSTTGIRVGFPTINHAAVVLIEANQIVGWRVGVLGGDNATINRNSVQSNDIGVGVGLITGNVLTANRVGIAASSRPDKVVGNALYGNEIGIDAGPAMMVQRNNIFGNGCGLSTEASGVLATDNYWGAATGPGANPADNVCGSQAGGTIVTPFATKPFKVSAPILISWPSEQ